MVTRLLWLLAVMSQGGCSKQGSITCYNWGAGETKRTGQVTRLLWLLGY